MNDIFEKIIEREIPADIVYEDEYTIAFLDIRPINKGHTLVVPKKKFENIFDADPKSLDYMIEAAQKVAQALLKTAGVAGVNIIMNNGDVAGQDVFHAHMHVVPRLNRGEAFVPNKHYTYTEGEAAETAKQLLGALSDTDT
jgi:histidine triad (HIT) family protein